MLDGDRLLVGVEIGALSVSTDFGESFTELEVDPDPRERDIHRILVHPQRPDRIIVANGIVGLMTSDDRGKTWRRNKMPDKANYPDAIVLSSGQSRPGVHDGGHRLAVELVRGRPRTRQDPAQPLTAVRPGRGCSAVCRTASARCSPRSPSRHRSAGTALYAADTDGQVFESLNEGETWTVIADVPPVSKGEFYRALVRERPKMANIDDIALNQAQTQRVQEAAVGAR